MSFKNINKLFALESLKWRKIENKATEKQALLISTANGSGKTFQGKQHLTSLKDFVDFIVATIGVVSGKWGIKSQNIVQNNATFLNFKGNGVTVNENLPDLEIEISADMKKSVYDNGSDSGIVKSAQKIDGVGATGNDRYYGTDSGGTPGFYDLPNAGQVVYDGVDTEAVILAKDPAAFLGKAWWAFDTKMDYRAITSGSSGNVWQKFSPADFKASNDTWSMPNTPDGHSLDLGQETFISSRNVDITGATALDPKVFAVAGVDPVDPKIKEVIKVLAGDINSGVQFGINNVSANTGELTKITTFGTINNVNTSAWSLLDILYISSTTKGDLTNIKPTSDPAYVVGEVLKVHATEGVIEVIASKEINDFVAIVPAGITFSWFTADQTDGSDPAGLNNFYKVLPNAQGVLASATQIVTVPSDSIVGVSKDHLGIQVPIQVTFKAGVVAGNIEYEISSTSATKKLYIEIYHAKDNGDVIDVPNSLPVGDRGVRPIVVVESAIIDPAIGIVLDTLVQGIVTQDVILLQGERIRYHIMCEKIGTTGPSIDFTIYYGSDHLTRFEFPRVFFLNDIEDVNIVTPQEGHTLIYDTGTGLWKNAFATVAAAGNNTEVQFNNAGALDGGENLTWDGTNSLLIGSGAISRTQITKGNIFVYNNNNVNVAAVGQAGNTGILRLKNTSNAIAVDILAEGNGYINNGANFGIGVVVPSEKLEVNGNVLATDYLLSSDMRYKTLVQDLGGNDFKYFSFNRGNESLRYGVSAQQVREVAPELVHENKEGKLSVSYNDMIIRELARLTKEVNELNR